MGTYGDQNGVLEVKRAEARMCLIALSELMEFRVEEEELSELCVASVLQRLQSMLMEPRLLSCIVALQEAQEQIVSLQALLRKSISSKSSVCIEDCLEFIDGEGECAAYATGDETECSAAADSLECTNIRMYLQRPGMSVPALQVRRNRMLARFRQLFRPKEAVAEAA